MTGALLAPHLGVRSMGQLDAFFEYICSPSALEAFFKSDACASERAAILERMEIAVYSPAWYACDD